MYLFCGKWDQLVHQEVIRIEWLFKQLIQGDYTANVANLDLLCSHLAHTNVCKPITQHQYNIVGYMVGPFEEEEMNVLLTGCSH